MNNFKRTICALSALVLAPAYAGAQTINTIPLWSGSTTIAPFGPPNTQTYGQTITVPAGLPVLQYFSFEMNVPAAEVFRGEVYAWNGTSATGPNLFESAPMSTAGTGIQLVTFQTGGIYLTPGSQYVLFATTSKDSQAPNAGNWGIIFSDVYAGGAFVYQNNGTDITRWATPTWNDDGFQPAGDDLAFQANFVAGDAFQISYAANLSVGDTVVDITNTGASGAALQSGTTASITGAICANVYAFTPDEQLVSCCSCPVTPNGLVSLSAKNDLASNTLTPAVPTALVIKLLATVPVGGSCNNSAAAVTTATLAPGLQAYSATIHATPVAGTYGVTEQPFSKARLSTGELSRIGNLCNFILANGSGFGICRSCRLGGLGAVQQ